MNRSSDEDDRANLKSIFGALFFGVPSLGMDVEALLVQHCTISIGGLVIG
jgi:hypothetical protein